MVYFVCVLVGLFIGSIITSLLLCSIWLTHEIENDLEEQN